MYVKVSNWNARCTRCPIWCVKHHNIPGCCGQKRCYSGRSLHCPQLRYHSPLCASYHAAVWQKQMQIQIITADRVRVYLHYLCALRWLCLPGHSLYLQPLFYAVGQGLLVVVFANAGQHSLLVGFVFVTAGINLAWNGMNEYKTKSYYIYTAFWQFSVNLGFLCSD